MAASVTGQKLSSGRVWVSPVQAELQGCHGSLCRSYVPSDMVRGRRPIRGISAAPPPPSLAGCPWAPAPSYGCVRAAGHLCH